MTSFIYLSVGCLFDLNGELFVKTKVFGEDFHKCNAFCLSSDNPYAESKATHINCETRVTEVRSIEEWQAHKGHMDDLFYVNL